LKNNVWMINVGSNYKTSKTAVEIAQKYKEGVWAAVGLHPLHLDSGLVKMRNDINETESQSDEEAFDYQKYKILAQDPDVVAIGEIGLDYYWKPKTKKKLSEFKEKQKKLLLRQIELARELGLPVIFHCRMAHNDLIDIFNSQLLIRDSKFKGVIHSFTGGGEQAREYLKMGFYLGFNGIIFKSIDGIDFKRIIKETPLEKILVETDCPYLTPPHFSEKRNNPLGVRYVAREIAEIKKVSLDEVAKITSENARTLFQI